MWKVVIPGKALTLQIFYKKKMTKWNAHLLNQKSAHYIKKVCNIRGRAWSLLWSGTPERCFTRVGSCPTLKVRLGKESLSGSSTIGYFSNGKNKVLKIKINFHLLLGWRSKSGQASLLGWFHEDWEENGTCWFNLDGEKDTSVWLTENGKEANVSVRFSPDG